MRKLDEAVQWGTDDVRAKGGDYFAAKSSRRHNGASAAHHKQDSVS
jgi:hypothetical protein